MASKVDVPLILIKTAAVSGIGFVLVNFTVKAVKMARNIILASPEEETSPKKHLLLCQYCRRHFFGDYGSIRWVLSQSIY